MTARYTVLTSPDDQPKQRANDNKVEAKNEANANAGGAENTELPKGRFFGGAVALRAIDVLKPAWSDEQLGVQLGLSHFGEKRRFQSGDTVHLAMFIRNTGNETIAVELSLGYIWNIPKILDSQGSQVQFYQFIASGLDVPFREVLKPGEAYGLRHPVFCLGEPAQAPGYSLYWQQPVPGHYSLTHTERLKVTVIDSAKDSQSAKFTTGKLEFEVGAREAGNKKTAKAATMARFGGIMPSFDRENGAWHATHIVVADGGDDHDGEFKVIESWKGDLKAGQQLSIPELAIFADPATRKISERYGRREDDTRKVVTGRKMVLFLVESDEREQWHSAMMHFEHRHHIDFSVVWVEDQDTYAIKQPISPGPNVIVVMEGGLAKLKSDVERFVKLQSRMNTSAEIEDPAKRATALREFAVSDSWHARRDGLALLAGSGTSAAPVLRGIINNENLAKFHGAAITSLAKALGDDSPPALIEILQGETLFWKKTAPALPIGWWSVRPDLHNRYGRLVATSRALKKNPHPTALDAVQDLRDFWRSLSQLDDRAGTDEISENCDRILYAIKQAQAEATD